MAKRLISEAIEEAKGLPSAIDLDQAEHHPDPELETVLMQLDEVTESLRRLEFSREDAGWEQIAASGENQFQRSSLDKHAKLCRVMAVANPLIKRGLALRAAYVFGQGVGTTADNPAVNEVIQTWLDDAEVRDVFSGAEAQQRNEMALGTDGNVFFAMFTDPLTGRVRPRVIPFEEITEVVTNPEDRLTVEYFRRDFSRRGPDGKTVSVSEYHPSLNFRPRTRPKFWGEENDKKRVVWDAPVFQVKVNALPGWDFGIGDAFAALPWARLYKEFLEDWAILTKALSRIAYQRVDASGKGTARLERGKMEKIYSSAAGSSVDATDGTKLEAVSKSGATIDADSGRQIAAMVATSLGIPVTMLLSDPGQTGARAVAETLDEPTRLEMQARQEVWREARRQLLNYVIDQAVIAPGGSLRGTSTWDGDRLETRLASEQDRTIVTTFPDLSKIPTETLVSALVDAAQYLPQNLLSELLMRALGVRDVDEWLGKLYNEDGTPKNDPYVAAGSAAAQALRRGNDPTQFV